MDIMQFMCPTPFDQGTPFVHHLRKADGWACEVKDRSLSRPHKERRRRLVGGNDYGYWNPSALLGAKTDGGEIRVVHVFRIPPEQKVALNVKDDTQ